MNSATIALREIKQQLKSDSLTLIKACHGALA
jgi:hypothetical protein